MVEHLEISYKAPTKANQFLVVKTEPQPDTEVVNGAKVINLQLVIELADGKVLVKANARLRDTGRATHQLAAENRKWRMW